MANISVAIDGLSKCGKSTLAKRIAKEFGILYIDSGALYRFATYLLKKPVFASESSLAFFRDVEMDSDGNIVYAGKKYIKEIESNEVNDYVSIIAQDKRVRDAVNAWIRRTAAHKSLTIDGRDIGTTVLPNATIKLYLYSSLEYRTDCWRKRQLTLFGYIDPELEKKEIDNIRKRDYNDLHRSVAPLRCAEDALRFDVEQVSIDEIFSQVKVLMRAVLLDRTETQ